MLFSFSADVLGNAGGSSEETSSSTRSSLLTSMFSTNEAEKNYVRRFVFAKTATLLSFDSWEIFLFCAPDG